MVSSPISAWTRWSKLPAAAAGNAVIIPIQIAHLIRPNAGTFLPLFIPFLSAVSS
jgi:hypothetical protein